MADMNLLNKIRYNMALNRVARLEHEGEFISEFFCGKTMYPLKLAKWEKDYKEAKDRLAQLREME